MGTQYTPIGATKMSAKTDQNEIDISPEQAQPGDVYIWIDAAGTVKVNEPIMARQGNLVQIALTRWLSLFPEIGTVQVKRVVE
jgi:hypothetical protein